MKGELKNEEGELFHKALPPLMHQFLALTTMTSPQ